MCVFINKLHAAHTRRLLLNDLNVNGVKCERMIHTFVRISGPLRRISENVSAGSMKYRFDQTSCGKLIKLYAEFIT